MAYHITWTCYGQWLHGDARGYVDRRSNDPDTPYAHGGTSLYNASADRMKERAVWLSETQRRMATESLRRTCHFKTWELLAVNVQPDHVHVVIRHGPAYARAAMRLLKGWATRALKTTDPTRTRWWTDGGKVEFVRSAARLAQVVAYVGCQPFPQVEPPA